MTVYLDGIIYSLQKGGGISRYTSELARGLAAAGCDLKLLRHAGAAPAPASAEIIPIRSGWRNRNRLAKYLTYFLDKRATEAFFKRENFSQSLFHSTYYTYYENFARPQLVNVHDLAQESLPQFFHRLSDKMFLRQKRRAIEKAAGLICISAQTAAELKLYYKVDPAKVHVTPLGVNPIFAPAGTEAIAAFRKEKSLSRPYILFVGQRGLYKNFPVLLDAFSRWTRSGDFDLVAVGGGAFTATEEKMILAHGLTGRVQLFTGVSDKDLVLFYGAAAAFVFPSSYEGFGLPILEALACGTPVVASDIPVFREVGGSCPRYFSLNEKDGLTAALDSALIKDETKRAAGLARAREFTWKETIRKTLEIYGRFSR